MWCSSGFLSGSSWGNWNAATSLSSTSSINGGIIIHEKYVKKILDGEPLTCGPSTMIVNNSKNLAKDKPSKVIRMEEGPRPKCTCGAAKRRNSSRRPRKNPEAINFLRRMVLVIVLIELMLAVSESSLMSTFFLFLTMSTTFDVKPENVIDSYCYYEAGGNSMCEDYMARSTGFTPSTIPHYRAVPTSAGNYYNYNFPNVVPSLEDQSFELFLAFNQSFYEAPARFSLEFELDSAVRNEKLSKLIEAYLEHAKNQNQNESHNQNGTNDDDDIPSYKKMRLATFLESSHFAEHLRQKAEILGGSAPFLPKEVPQVKDAMKRSKFKSQGQIPNQNQNQGKQANKNSEELRKEAFDNLVHRLSQPLTSSSHEVKKVKEHNIIQAKDFIRHRWKRQSDDDPSKTVTKPPNLSLRIITSKSKIGQGPDGRNPEKMDTFFSGGKSGNDEQKNIMKNSLMNEKQEETITTPLQTARISPKGNKEMQHKHDDDDDDDQPTLIPTTIESSQIPIPTSSPPQEILNKFEDEVVLREYMKEHLHHPTHPDSEKQMSVESYLTLAMMMNKKVEGSDQLLKTLRNDFKQQQQQQTTQQQKEQHSKSEHQQASGSGSSSKKKSQRVSPKYFQELYMKVERSPRHLLALMETSLFNNWKCFMELTKFIYRKNGGGGGAAAGITEKGSSSCRDCSTAAKDIFEDLPTSEATRLEILQNLSLGMDMDIFHPKTYQKAERRKRAMQQTYHDYTSAVMKELTTLKDLPVSHSFYMVFMVVKMYALLWYVVLGCVLFLGCVMEDKTALNIWGIFAILTSLLHFIVEEWIDTTFQPDKTAAALWFSIILRVYKPLSVLIVLTLSSEILKRDGCSRQRGLGTCLFELVKGKKHGKKCSDKVSSTTTTATDGDAGFPTAVTVTKLQFRRTELDNGKIVYTNMSPSKAALYTRATCVICGATAKFSSKLREQDPAATTTNAGDNGEEAEAVNGDDGKNNKMGIHCSCAKPNNLSPDEIFDFSDVENDEEDEEEDDDDDDERELEIVGDEEEEEEEEDTDEDDRYEYERETQEESEPGEMTMDQNQISVDSKKKKQQQQQKPQPAMVVILSEAKNKYGMNRKEEAEPGKQDKGKDKIDDKNNNIKQTKTNRFNPLLVVGDEGAEGGGVAVVDGANLYI